MSIFFVAGFIASSLEDKPSAAEMFILARQGVSWTGPLAHCQDSCCNLGPAAAAGRSPPRLSVCASRWAVKTPSEPPPRRLAQFDHWRPPKALIGGSSLDGSRSLVMRFRFDIRLCRILTAALSLHRLFGCMLLGERFAPLRAISNSIHEGISRLRHKLIKVLHNVRLGDSGLNNLGAGISVIQR